MPQFILSHISKVVREPVRKQIAQTAFIPAWVASGCECDACRFQIEEHNVSVMVLQIQHGHRLYLHAECARSVIVDEAQ